MKPRLSLCMITKNEEQWLEKAIRSVENLVSEIIVVDTGSTDTTCEIAKKLGARLETFEWQDDFAKARNYSLSLATGDWILVLDADEIIDAQGIETISKWLENPTSNAAVLVQTTYSNNNQLMLWQANNLSDEAAQNYTGYLESPLIRLFKRDPNIVFEGMVHEDIVDKTGGRLNSAKLDVRIHHYGLVKEQHLLDAKKDLYFKIAQKKFEANPQDAKAAYDYAASAWDVNLLDEAKKGFLQTIKILPNHADSLFGLGSLAKQTGDSADAQNYLTQAISVNPRHVGSYINLSDLYLKTRQLSKAEDLLKQALTIMPEHPQILERLDRLAKRKDGPVLSLCMIVKNESPHLHDCLQSVKDLVDEIIVVDTGSTDDTVDIAKSYGAKVSFFEWQDDFAKARNVSLERATGDWALVLDADEVIEQKDFDRIRDLIQNPSSSMYYLNQTTYCTDSATFGWIPNDLKVKESEGYLGYVESSLVRLFKLEDSIRFHGLIHEHAENENRDIKPTVTDIRIHHYGKYIDKLKSKNKDEFYLKLGKIKCENEPHNAHAFYELGVQHWVMGHHDEATQALYQSVELDPNYVRAHVALAGIAYMEDDKPEVLNRYAKVLEVDPTNILPYLYLPNVLVEMNNFEFAEEIIAIGQQYADSQPSFHINCGIVKQAIGNFRASLDCFDRALKINPQEALAYLNKGISYLSLQDWDKAETNLNKAVEFEQTKTHALSRLSEHYYNQKKYPQAYDSLHQAQQNDPGDQTINYHLAILLIKLGRLDEAKLILDQIADYNEFKEQDLTNLIQCNLAVGNNQKADHLRSLLGDRSSNHLSKEVATS